MFAPIAANACDIKPGTYKGTWNVIGQKTLIISSVDAQCTAATGTYDGQPVNVPITNRSVIAVACGPNGAGTCTFKKEGAVLKASYADSQKRTNQADFMQQ